MSDIEPEFIHIGFVNNTKPPYDIIIQNDNEPEIFILKKNKNKNKSNPNKINIQIIKFNLIDESQTQYNITTEMSYYLSRTIFNPLCHYSNIQISSIIKRISNETTNEIKYVLLLLSTPQQIIYRISLEQEKVTSIGHCRIIYNSKVATLHPYLRILKFETSHKHKHTI